MKIFHLNCGTCNAFGFPQEEDLGGFIKRGKGVLHCLLADTGEGLVLIDTGLGISDCSEPSQRVKFFAKFVGCPRDVNETAHHQLVSLGYHPSDVKHIFMTHMHLDHAGGLPDFPAAEVHLHTDELNAFLHPKTLMERYAYVPEHADHHPNWQPHSFQGDQLFGLECLPPIQIGEIQFVMIPFPGHSRGHCGVAVRINDHWLFHCGDSYVYYRQVGIKQPFQYPCGKLMENLLTLGLRIPRDQWARIRKLVQTYPEQIQTICAHDAHEFELYRE